MPSLVFQCISVREERLWVCNNKLYLLHTIAASKSGVLQEDARPWIALPFKGAYHMSRFIAFCNKATSFVINTLSVPLFASCSFS